MAEEVTSLRQEVAEQRRRILALENDLKAERKEKAELKQAKGAELSGLRRKAKEAELQRDALAQKLMRKEEELRLLQRQEASSSLRPINIHRWRFLEGSDPSHTELIRKTQKLQRRLVAAETQLKRRDDGGGAKKANGYV